MNFSRILDKIMFTYAYSFLTSVILACVFMIMLVSQVKTKRVFRLICIGYEMYKFSGLSLLTFQIPPLTNKMI